MRDGRLRWRAGIGPAYRRLAGAAVLLALLLEPDGLTRSALAQHSRHHAVSKIGQFKLGPGFTHFDWANPQAPKGGTLRLASIGTFDNLNGHTYRGTAAPYLAVVNDSLMTPSSDEPATAYAAVAEWVSFPDDLTSATFQIREGARFHDGRPITPSDLVYSLDAVRKASPSLATYLRDVTSAEQTGDRQVTYRFARAGSRDMPYAVGLLPILPRHYWTGKGANGEPRDITRTTLEPPVGSGPYRIKSVDPGRAITYERVADWWARDLPVNRGLYNFDQIRVTMFRDEVPLFEAVKSGDIDVHVENISRRWATQYTFPALKDGRIVQLVHKSGAVAPMQGFILNMRRPKFADARVRRAFALAYDFESANTSLFYGLYTRVDSYFENSELAATGVPDGRELQLLDKWRAGLPPEVFGPAYKSPVNATPELQRANLREALRLLDAAGWKLSGGTLRNKSSNEAMTVEFLLNDNTFDRIILPYQRSLEKIGIRLSIRVVDSSQFEERLKNYDYEMTVDVVAQSHAPGNELREYFSSLSADRPASRNRAGIKIPAVDALVEDVIYAPDRAQQVAAARALDRVLLWHHTIIPQWYNANNWIAHSSRLGRPDRLPAMDPAWLAAWWVKPLATSAPGKERTP